MGLRGRVGGGDRRFEVAGLKVAYRRPNRPPTARRPLGRQCDARAGNQSIRDWSDREGRIAALYLPVRQRESAELPTRRT